MRKRVIIPLALILLITIFVCFKFGPRRASHTEALPAESAVLETPPNDMPAVLVPEPRAHDDKTVGTVTSDQVSTSSGLITLSLNPMFSKTLPSMEEQKKALAMNEKFMRRTSGQ